jgi:hypothetical protein
MSIYIASRADDANVASYDYEVFFGRAGGAVVFLAHRNQQHMLIGHRPDDRTNNNLRCGRTPDVPRLAERRMSV